jgi:hypothetical protein
MSQDTPNAEVKAVIDSSNAILDELDHQSAEARPNDAKAKRWPGPISRRTPASALWVRRCVSCGRPLTAGARQRGEWWCLSCKDPAGFTLRVQQAHHEAAQRCAARYPAREATQEDLFL